MTARKQIHQFARQLFRLSLVDGRVSAERVAGVLAYLEKHPPAHGLMVLKRYHRLVAAQWAKNQAIVEHAGAISDQTLPAIADALSRKHGRVITAAARPNPALIAGLRIRVGDDVYESSLAGQLATLASLI